jgi:hypothetical protein
MCCRPRFLYRRQRQGPRRLCGRGLGSKKRREEPSQSWRRAPRVGWPRRSRELLRCSPRPGCLSLCANHERRAASHHQLGLTRPTSPFAHSPTCAERTEDEARKIDVTPRRPQELDPGLGFLFSPDHGGRGARAREMRGACDTPLATRPALAVATPLSFASHRKLTAGGANEKFQRADRRTKPLMLTHPVFILSARRAVLALRPSCYVNQRGAASDQWRCAIGSSLRCAFLAAMDGGQRF